MATTTAATTEEEEEWSRREGEGEGGDDDWRRVSISIATSAARGVEGYHVADDWTLRCRSLLLHPDDDGARRRSLPVDGTADFGEALKSLPVRECYRSRLANALDALDSATKALLSEMTTAATTRGSRAFPQARRQTGAMLRPLP